MARVDPKWSLDAVLRNYRPHDRWRKSFSPAYVQAIESADPGEQLAGWRTAAHVFGDLHVPVFCLFVCRHARALEPPGESKLQGHIDLCLWEIGLATPTRPDAAGTVAVADVGKPDGFRRDEGAAYEWLADQLRPFGGKLELAARFAMRLTAARLGLLHGPAEPTIAQVLDESLWIRVSAKPWWKLW